MGDLPHIENGDCWCEHIALRPIALDVLYPDRCQITEHPDTPHDGLRNCVLVANHEQPCRGGLERPGSPCHFCGNPTVLNTNGPGCPTCWTDLTGMTTADIKALFAARAPELSIDPSRAADA